MFLPSRILEKKLLELLVEDVGLGDITSALIVPTETCVDAVIISNESAIVAGIEEAKTLLQSLGLEAKGLLSDGEKIKPKQTMLKISGDARTILSAERTVLNILSRMSGIATITRTLVEKLQDMGVKARVACTRKSAPGLLYFDKKAVMIGGGDTHRLHLDDMILIKDNHIAIAGSVAEAVGRARQRASLSKKIEVEVTKIEDALAAAEAGADIIMLDNFSPRQVKEAAKLLSKKRLNGKILLEASGGITTKNALLFAAAGVDLISLGEITHSVKAVDLSLEIMRVRRG